MAPYALGNDVTGGGRMAELSQTVWTAPVRNGVWVAARFGHR
jgi:hypothetical protein